MTLTSANSSPVDATSSTSPQGERAFNAGGNGNAFVFDDRGGGGDVGGAAAAAAGLSPNGGESRSCSPPNSLSISTRGNSYFAGISCSSSSSSSTGHNVPPMGEGLLSSSHDPAPQTAPSPSLAVAASGNKYESLLDQVRTRQTLHIKVAEAKNLPIQTRSHSVWGKTTHESEARDTFCVVSLDHEEIFRTNTVEKTNNPFYSEEFKCQVPRSFRYLNYYVYDRGLKQSKPLGKVSLKREELTQFQNRDTWFPLHPVDADSEVQGKVHVEIRTDELTGRSSSSHYLSAVEVGGGGGHAYGSPTRGSVGSSSSGSSVAGERTSSVLGGQSTSSLGGGGRENSGGGYGNNKLVVRVLECSDLNIIHGCCDPYMEISLWCCCPGVANALKIDMKKSKVKRKTQNPRYNESFVFDYLAKIQSKDNNHFREFSGILEDDLDKLELRLTVWHYHISGDSFLGEVKIALESLKGQPSVYNAWYFLQPRRRALPSSSTSTSLASASGSSLAPPSSMSLTSSPSSPAPSSFSHSSFLNRNAVTSSPTFTSNALFAPSNLGSLRLRITYMEDHIFPRDYYEALGKLLYHSHLVKPIPCSAAFLLGELVDANNRSEAAQSIVRLFMNKRKIVHLLRALAEDEISNTCDPTVLFRGNTVATKCIDEFMKIAGSHYLHYTLKSIIDEIFSDHRSCEIDATLLRREDNITENYENLKSYVVRIVLSITDSALVCPTLFCEVFYSLKEAAVKYFPEQQEAVKYVVVSGFIFLRFFAPAILGPRLFQLRQDTPDALTQRTLTLISKAIQGLGNLVCSPNSVRSVRNRDKSYKETYMQPLYTDLIETVCLLDAVRRFLDIISCAKRAHAQIIEEPIILKEGFMTKRAQGRRRWGRKNFKQRFFCLTTNGFYYSKEKGSPALCQMPLEDILAVETLEEESFKMKNMFQVIQPARTLYIQAPNCVEETEWVDVLTKISLNNRGRLKQYHPAAYLNGQYQCCKAAAQNAPGCEPVSALDESLLPIRLEIDEEAEMQRIHSLFLSKMSEMERLKLECEAHILHENPSGSSLPSSLPASNSGALLSHAGRSTLRESTSGVGVPRQSPSPSPSPSSSKGTAVPSTATSATIFFPPSFSSSSYPPPSGTASSASSTPNSLHGPPTPPSNSLVPANLSSSSDVTHFPAPPPPRTPKTPKTLSAHSSSSSSGCLSSSNVKSHHGLSSPPPPPPPVPHHSSRVPPPPLTPPCLGAVGGHPAPRTPPGPTISPPMSAPSTSASPSFPQRHHKPPPPPPPLQVNFTPITDPNMCLRTVEDILGCVKKLHQDHTQYLRALYKATQYGSKQAPIGDDNYLKMAAALKNTSLTGPSGVSGLELAASGDLQSTPSSVSSFVDN